MVLLPGVYSRIGTPRKAGRSRWVCSRTAQISFITSRTRR
nr:MAG TPA: hypothetical protein [Caudoviricetes sp.]